MRPGRPIQLTLSISHDAVAANRVVSLIDAGSNIIEDSRGFQEEFIIETPNESSS